MANKREIQGLWLPPSRVVVKLQEGAEMPPLEEFATTMSRIKSGHGAYAVAMTFHGLYALGWPMVLTKGQAQRLVEVYPQFDVFD